MGSLRALPESVANHGGPHLKETLLEDDDGFAFELVKDAALLRMECFILYTETTRQCEPPFYVQ